MKVRVGITFNQQRKPETKKPAMEIAGWLKDNGCKAYVNPTKKVLETGLDFIIVLGGDGMILHAADKVADFAIPLIGVNFGHKGYLCDVEYNEVFEKLKKVLNGDFGTKRRTRVQAEVFRENKRTRTISGLNEILIGGINRTVFLEIRVIGKNKEFEAEVIGDGILISTQIGSTAYNINAGGAVLLTDAFSVVANNGLFKSDFLLPNTKSFVTSVEAVFEVRILNPHKQNLPYIVADGQRNYRFKNGDFVVIKRSEKETLFVRV